jgi:hypothetical protein
VIELALTKSPVVGDETLQWVKYQSTNGSEAPLTILTAAVVKYGVHNST